MKKIALIGLLISISVAASISFYFLKQKSEKVSIQKAVFEIKLSIADEQFSSSLVNSDNIKNVEIARGNNDYQVLITLDDRARKVFENVTTENVGKSIGFFIDGVLISLPNIEAPISDGQLVIAGDFSNNEALSLKARLQGYYYSNSPEYKDFKTNTSRLEVESNKILEDVGGIEIRASHILICFKGAPTCESELSKESAYKKIKELQSNVTTKNFALLAEKNSMEKIANTSKGALGWFGRGVMVKSFEDTVFNQKIGTISPIIETEFGYHLIYKEEERKKIK